MSKTILLHLPDDDGHGRIKASLDGTNVIVYSIPVASLHKCRGMEHMNHPGIYVLVNNNLVGKTEIYIGKADIRENGSGILERVNYHRYEDKKDFRQVLMIVSENREQLDDTRLSYLERAFYNLAEAADRCVLTNRRKPSARTIRKEFQAAIDDFIANSVLLIEALGKNYFTLETLDQSSAESSVERSRFFLNRVGVEAEGELVNEGFLVFAGAKLRAKSTKSAPKIVDKLREYYADRIKDNRLTRDTVFSSPSAAAIFLTAASVNGRAVWKTTTGQTLDDYDKQLQNGDKPESMVIPPKYSSPQREIYHLCAREVVATGYFDTENKFVVLAGSTVRAVTSPSMPASTRQLRERYASVISSNSVLLEDISFSSSSAAAKFLIGTSVSGPLAWKAKDGRSLREVRQ